MKRFEQVFHAGERAIQDRAGVPDAWRERASHAIRDAMPAQHRDFFESLPVLFLALADAQGRPWATAVFGAPGFARASPQALTLAAAPLLAEEIGLDIRPGAKAGVLGLEFETRRRNRMNGTITAAGSGGLTIGVDQSFGNCPKYIRPRGLAAAAAMPPPAGTRISAASAAARRILAAADTFFIATSLPGGGADVSHRGGRPGFLSADAGGRLSFPDYSGNRYFNTLGNIEASGQAGLLVPDFQTGEALLLTGRAGIDWSAARAGTVEGAERMIDIQPAEAWHLRNTPLAAPPATA